MRASRYCLHLLVVEERLPSKSRLVSLPSETTCWWSYPVPPGAPAPAPILCGHLLWRFAIQQQSTAPALRSTPLPWLPVLSNIEPPTLRRKAATDKLVEKIVKHDSWPIQPDVLNPPLLRLTSRKPLWLDLQPVDIKSRWRHNWKSAQVVNSHLMCDPTIWHPGFDLPQQQWSLLNNFRTEQGHCGACRRKWRLTDTDLCPCGETQTMSYIVESCTLTKLNGGLSRLHSADEDAVSWLTGCGLWHAYEKKKITILIQSD